MIQTDFRVDIAFAQYTINTHLINDMKPRIVCKMDILILILPVTSILGH